MLVSCTERQQRKSRAEKPSQSSSHSSGGVGLNFSEGLIMSPRSTSSKMDDNVDSTKPVESIHKDDTSSSILDNDKVQPDTDVFGIDKVQHDNEVTEIINKVGLSDSQDEASIHKRTMDSDGINECITVDLSQKDELSSNKPLDSDSTVKANESIYSGDEKTSTQTSKSILDLSESASSTAQPSSDKSQQTIGQTMSDAPPPIELTTNERAVNLPIYVYNCPLSFLTEQLVNKSTYNRPKDFFEDLRFQLEENAWEDSGEVSPYFETFIDLNKMKL